MLFGDEMKKVFLAGIGAVASTFEAGQKVIDKLVEKGELTVQQGKVLNEELKHDFKGAKDNLKSGALKGGINILDNIEKLSKDELQQLKEKLMDLEGKSE